VEEASQNIKPAVGLFINFNFSSDHVIILYVDRK
jgi:hypothetical protein